MTSIIFENSIWPNGIKDDTEGYAIFYPLGTNKVTVPASKWPKGDKYISPFVYENEKLVGFIDSASLTLDEPLMIYLPYEYIDIKFPNIEKGTLQIHAPNAITKKVSWSDGVVEDIPEAQFKYKGCTTVDDVKTVDANYQTINIVDGVWSEPLWDLKEGTDIFYECDELTLFESSLPNLTNGTWMFTSTGLTTFDTELPKLEFAYSMFNSCVSLESFSSELPSLTDGDTMFNYCTNLKSFNGDLPKLKTASKMFCDCWGLTSFSVKLPSLEDGSEMFCECAGLTSFTSELPNLKSAYKMFDECDQLASFSVDLPKLESGGYMFNLCSNLASFTPDLPALILGNSMFHGCTSLTSFSSSVDNLSNGEQMFMGCTSLNSFTSNLPSLVRSSYMFNSCTSLTSFSPDLSNVINGALMFYNDVALTTISSDLSNLTSGYDMFYKCSLDAKSVKNIANSIKDIAAEKQLYIDGSIPYVTVDKSSYPSKYSASKGFMSDGKYVYTYNDPEPYTATLTTTTVGSLTLGINVTNDSATVTQQLEDFAHEATFDSWAALKQAFVDKGWTVAFQYGGTNTSITYSLRNNTQSNPCQIFAKLIESDEETAKYTSNDDSAFYDVVWGHDVTDTTGYTRFNSLEEAIETLNIKPIERQ